MEESTYNAQIEVRFAVVMYGGVSLAIYINGVAQELFRLVRATAPNEAGSALAVEDEGLSDLEKIYREVGRKRTSSGWDDEGLEAGDGVASRFVIDILSGTSAGGINGILLAKALANGLPDIDSLKTLWINEGQIDDLLNEPGAYEGIDGIAYQEPPTSLLAGDRLYAKALEAIQGMDDRAAVGAPAYAEQVDLAVTMTDLQGLWLPIQLADGSVLEPHHKAALKFLYSTEAATGDERNDFQGQDRLLAFAARATSSFPFAFAPIELSDVVPTPTDEEEALFAEWIHAESDYRNLAFADGGYLQNKPFSQATQALKRRRADVPVDRKLIYLEPDPQPIPKDHKVAQPRPDAIANTGAALVGLPSTQPIRDDIETLRERNAAVERIERAKRDLGPMVVEGGLEPVPPGPVMSAYMGLRVTDVVEALTDAAARSADLPLESDRAAAMRLAFRAHAAHSQPDLYVDELDLQFRRRRLGYVKDRITELLRGDSAADGLLAAAKIEVTEEGRHAWDPWLLSVNQEIAKRLKELRALGRGIRARRGQEPSEIDARASVLARSVEKWEEEIVGFSDPRLLSEALWARDSEIREATTDFVSAVKARLGEAPEFTTDVTFAEIAPDTAHPAGFELILQQTYDWASSIDMAIYPVSWPGLNEEGPVSIHRISPRDAPSLVPMPELDTKGKPVGKPRLAGVSLAHFGGFLDRAWRRNDMLWGRLDAAERLTAMLVPDQLQDEYRVRAHAAILREEFDALVSDEAPEEERNDLMTLIKPHELAAFRRVLDGSNDPLLVECFPVAYGGPVDLERSRQIGLGLSASAVGGKVLAGNRRRGISLIGRTIGRLRPLVGALIKFHERVP